MKNLQLLLHQARYDLLSIARNPRARVFTLAFPLILLVILVGLETGHTTVDGADVAIKRFLVGGILAMSLMVSSYASVIASVVNQRENGVFKRRRGTPVPSWIIIAGQAISTLAIAASSAAVLLVVAKLAFGVGVSVTGLVSVALAVLVGALGLSCVAYAVASVIPNVDTVQPVVQLTMLPIYFVSGLWFSTDDVPDALRKIGEALPVEPIAHTLHRAFMDPGIDLSDLGVLAAWALAGIVIAARRFTWLPRSA